MFQISNCITYVQVNPFFSVSDVLDGGQTHEVYQISLTSLYQSVLIGAAPFLIAAFPKRKTETKHVVYGIVLPLAGMVFGLAVMVLPLTPFLLT